jgi:hypothetical protein
VDRVGSAVGVTGVAVVAGSAGVADDWAGFAIVDLGLDVEVGVGVGPEFSEAEAERGVTSTGTAADTGPGEAVGVGVGGVGATGGVWDAADALESDGLAAGAEAGAASGFASDAVGVSDVGVAGFADSDVEVEEMLGCRVALSGIGTREAACSGSSRFGVSNSAFARSGAAVGAGRVVKWRAG